MHASRGTYLIASIMEQNRIVRQVEHLGAGVNYEILEKARR